MAAARAARRSSSSRSSAPRPSIPSPRRSPSSSSATIRNVSAVVESTGTGAGMKLFCGGVGSELPRHRERIAAIKKSEYEICVAAGVKNDHRGPGRHRRPDLHRGEGQPSSLNLTQADIYKALAANPFGKGPNTAQTWKDVNPALPAIKIRVLGPPPTSGTRDSLAELYLDKGCDTDPAMEALKKSTRRSTRTSAPRSARTAPSSRPARTTICSSRRSPRDPGTLGVLGYSYPRGECRQGPAGADRRGRADRSDDRRPVLSGRPQALHLSQGRASAREAGD